jgi:hypothetical protein
MMWVNWAFAFFIFETVLFGKRAEADFEGTTENTIKHLSPQYIKVSMHSDVGQFVLEVMAYSQT